MAQPISPNTNVKNYLIPDPKEYKKVAFVASLFFLASTIAFRVLYGKELSQYYPIPISVGLVSLIIGCVAFALMRKHPLQTWVEDTMMYIGRDVHNTCNVSQFDKITDETPILHISTGALPAERIKALFEEMSENSAEATKRVANISLRFEFTIGEIMMELRAVKGSVVHLKKILWYKFVGNDGKLTNDGKALLATGNRPIYYIGFENDFTLTGLGNLFCSISGDIDDGTLAFGDENGYGRALMEIRTILRTQFEA